MKKILVMVLMLCLMAVPTLAFIREQGYSKDAYVNLSSTECQVFNVAQPNCRVLQDYLVLDYKNNPDFYAGGNLEGKTADDTGRGVYTAYINFKVSPFNKTGDRYFGRVDYVVARCKRYDNNIGNNTDLGYFYNQTVTSAQNKTFEDFIEVKLEDNQNAVCTFNAIYKTQALFLSSSPVSWKLWKPTYKSTSQRPCQLALFKAQDNLAICQDDQIGTAVSDKEYVKSAIKSFLYKNYRLSQYMFWVFVIAILIFAIELILFMPFIIKRVMEKLLKMFKR